METQPEVRRYVVVDIRVNDVVLHEVDGHERMYMQRRDGDDWQLGSYVTVRESLTPWMSVIEGDAETEMSRDR